MLGSNSANVTTATHYGIFYSRLELIFLSCELIQENFHFGKELHLLYGNENRNMLSMRIGECILKLYLL